MQPNADATSFKRMIYPLVEGQETVIFLFLFFNFLGEKRDSNDKLLFTKSPASRPEPGTQ